MSNACVNILSYNLFREDYGRGGGVCLYVKDHLKVNVIDNHIEKQEGVEAKWLSVQHRKLPSVILGCIYRHPKAPAASFNYILDSFKNVILRNKPIFILGDFNDDLQKPDNKMSKLVNNLKLLQLITEPTRITRDSASLIDLFITNNKEMVAHSHVIPSPVGDHEAITVSLKLSKPKRLPVLKTFRCLKNYSQEKICNLLMNEVPILNGILSTDNVNIQVPILTNVLNNCIDNCAPLQTKEIFRPPAPWITDDIKASIKKRDKLQKDVKQDSDNLMLRDNYKEKKKEVNRLIDSSRKKYYREELKHNKNNLTVSWNIVKTMLFNNYNANPQLDNEDLVNKAEKFNDFFANVGKKPYERTQEEMLKDNSFQCTGEQLVSNGNPLNFFKPSPVDCNTVILTVKSLNESSAYGSDGISLRFIKDVLYIIAFYLTIIINTSIVTNTFPQLWKNPHVVPYYKSGDIDEVSNYMPVSLLPVLSKVLEKNHNKSVIRILGNK